MINMNKALPTAIIVGIEHFVAQRLAAILLSRDINVIGVGEYAGGFQEEKNYEYRVSLDEVEEKVNYVFDFVGEVESWELAVKGQAKLTVVSVNKKNIGREVVAELAKSNFNWRVVETFGVYGVGMEEDGFLAEAIRQAVRNENLRLPRVGKIYRLLSVEDAVEVILRASFLSGTEGEVYKIWGMETNTAEVAEVLIDEAKMTKMKVMQEEIDLEEEDEAEMLESRRKLRWQPEVGFSEGIKETLQYFFSKVDEENRRRKNEKRNITREVVEEIVEKPRLMEVMVEEEDEVVREVEPEPELELVVEEEDEEEEIQPLELKNSNMRPIAEEVDEEVEERVVESKMEKEEEREKKAELSEEIMIPRRKANPWKYWYVGVILSLFLVLVIPVWLGVVGVGTYRGVVKSLELIEERKLDEAEELIDKSLERVKRTDKRIDELGLNSLSWLRNYQKLLKVSEGVMVTGLSGMELLKSGDAMSEAVLGEKEIDWDNQVGLVRLNINDLFEESGVLQARLGGDWTWLPSRWRAWPQKGARQIDELRKDLELGDQILEVMPEILGLDGKKKEYMVLLQNETELRPGGGFIGSVAFLSFLEGRLTGFEVKDVYEIDGQLKGHVEPPVEIRDYLGEAGWFMRDANWNPNFMVSSAQIQWFLEKSVGKKVDGVIGMNLAVAKELLGVVGEVTVADFREKVNKDNLYEQAQFYAETKFFPGSIQKASFLGGVSKQLFEEIKLMDSNKKLRLGKVLLTMLESNDLQMAFNDKKVSSKMAEMSWDGAMYVGKCRNEDCVSDYLYVVEANVGVNKANYFLYRNIEQLVDIGQRSVSRIVKVNYENTAKNSNWPGGDYKNYLRVYLPNNINVAQVSISDSDKPESLKIYSRDELKIGQFGQKTELGFLVTVPVSSKRTVEIRYSSEMSLSDKDKYSYIHYIQRQPGYGDTAAVVLVSMPSSWQALQVQPSASLVGGKLLFNQKLDRDIKMGVELAR